MKKLCSFFVSVGLIFCSSLFATDAISIVKVNTNINKINEASPLWAKAKISKVFLYPQTTIHLNDKTANEANKFNNAQEVNVLALTDGRNIAFKMQWKDKTNNPSGSLADFPDGFAIQFAQDYSNTAKLPYIGMGSKDRPVVIYLCKNTNIFEPNADNKIDMQVNRSNTNLFGQDLKTFDKSVLSLAKPYKKAFIAEGFRSTTEIKDGLTSFEMGMKYTSSKWSGFLVRTLNDAYLNLNSDAFVISLAVWDGSQMGRDGLKYLSGWTIAEVVNKSKLATEFEKDVVGDIKKGEVIAKDNCSSCHNYNNEKNAPPFMAPNLSNIGGYATSNYLMESIIDPDAVVVPGYNVNAHSNTPWYNFDAVTKTRKSTMPSFGHLSDEEKTNLIAFLKTLKAGVKK